MCDFHSTIWRLLGQDAQMFHLASNSHAEMAQKSDWRENEPNRKTLIFEAEWNGDGEIPANEKLIRNFSECPEELVRRIRRHYKKLKEAISTGKNLADYFGDTKKWSDVWNKAIVTGVNVTLPSIFDGNLYVHDDARLEAAALTAITGDLYVHGDARLDALTAITGNLSVDGNARLDALTKITGNLSVYGNARLDALTAITGNLSVYGNARLDALAKIGFRGGGKTVKTVSASK